MKCRTKINYNDQMCRVFHDYGREYGDELVDLNDLYDWAIENRRWDKPSSTLRSIFKRDMSKALRLERILSDDGEPARRNHAIRIKEGDRQLYLWTDILTVKPSHMKMSLQQRKLVIAAAAIQHDRDVRFYNRYNTFGAQLEFDYNFNPHVEDAHHPKEYPSERPA